MGRLKEIFEKQKELMEVYHEIEHNSGVVTTTKVPVDIHSQIGQQRLRDFAWRITEETGEMANEVYELDGLISPEVEEEMVDILHFLVEFTIAAGVEPHEIQATIPYDLDNLHSLYNIGLNYGINKDFHHNVTDFITNLAMTINTLKNKAWKQKMVDTNVPLFKERLRKLWVSYFAMASSIRMTDSDIYKQYMNKNGKNKERQESGY